MVFSFAFNIPKFLEAEIDWVPAMMPINTTSEVFNLTASEHNILPEDNHTIFVPKVKTTSEISRSLLVWWLYIEKRNAQY